MVAEPASAFAAAVADAGGVVEEDRVVLARNLSAEGRSRAFVGGASVPAAVLGALTEQLVAVHGQADHGRLLRPDAQREALDRFAGAEAAEVAADYQRRYRRLRELTEELAALIQTRRDRAREIDLLTFGLAEVEAAAPRPGEDHELAAEESRLGFADTLRHAAAQAKAALSADGDGVDAQTCASAAATLLGSVRDHDPLAGELADRAAEIGYLIADLAGDVASYAAGIDTDPIRLAAVSERRAELARLTRKYGDTTDAVLEWSRVAEDRLTDLSAADDRIDDLSRERDQLLIDLADAAAALSAIRTAAAGRLADEVTREVRTLAMGAAELRVRVRQQPADEGLTVADRTVRFGPNGIDEVTFLLAANPGSEPRPLAKSASGGELSRIMLALEVVLIGTDPAPILIFDEVDAGVGGAAATEVGRCLARLAGTAQVVVVTHLPQVAAYADTQIQVAKSTDDTVTTTGLTVLRGPDRIRELARMLAGMADSDTALAHAEELLAAAAADRSR